MPKPEIGYTRRQLSEMHTAVQPYFQALMRLEHSSTELNKAKLSSLVTYVQRASVFINKLIETIEENIPVALYAYYSSREADDLAGDIEDWMDKVNTKKYSPSKLRAFIVNRMQPGLKEIGSQLASLLSTLELEHTKALGSQETPMSIQALSRRLAVAGVKHRAVIAAKLDHETSVAGGKPVLKPRKQDTIPEELHKLGFKLHGDKDNLLPTYSLKLANCTALCVTSRHGDKYMCHINGKHGEAIFNKVLAKENVHQFVLQLHALDGTLHGLYKIG